MPVVHCSRCGSREVYAQTDYYVCLECGHWTAADGGRVSDEKEQLNEDGYAAFELEQAKKGAG